MTERDYIAVVWTLDLPDGFFTACLWRQEGEQQFRLEYKFDGGQTWTVDFPPEKTEQAAEKIADAIVGELAKKGGRLPGKMEIRDTRAALKKRLPNFTVARG